MGTGHEERLCHAVSLVAGDEVELVLEFSSNQSRGSYYTYGFYPQVCSETNGEDKMCWFTQGESTTIRYRDI